MVMAPAMYKSLPYDTNRDFLPITDVVTFPLFVIVKGDSPIKTIKDLVAYIKAHPDKANYASSSSVFWLASELFAQQAGLNATRVQYKGAGNMVSAVLTGEVLFAIPSPPPVVGQAKAGAVRILATTAPHRLPAFPDVPTMAEAGVAGVTVVDWSGVWAPAGTSPEIVATLNKAVRQVLTMPEFAEKTSRIHVPPAGASEADFKKLITSELAMWKGVAEKAHISLTR